MSKPLARKTFLVTRADKDAKPLKQLIEKNGGSIISFPTIQIKGADDWYDVDEAIKVIKEYDWIIFTSKNSVDYFLNRCATFNVKPEFKQVAAIGTKTKRTLDNYSIPVQLMPADFTAKALLQAFAEYDLTGKKMLVPVSNIARKELTDGLTERDAIVDRVIVYKTDIYEPSNKNEIKSRIMKNEIDSLVFYSPSAFNNFSLVYGTEFINEILKKDIPIAVIGPTTADVVKKAGFSTIIQARNSTNDELVNAIIEYYH